MADINDFFAVLANEIEAAIKGLDPEANRRYHWIVIQDSVGITRSECEPSERAAHEILGSLLDAGVSGAAYITYVPRRPHGVIAYALVGGMRNSDVRRAAIIREGSSVVVGQWEPTV